MRARRSLRALPGLAALAAALAVAGCGADVIDTAPTTKADPAPAEKVLRSYLDDDRCDLLAPAMLAKIAPEKDEALRLCKNGNLPVDAAVRPGQYKVIDAESIDGKGLFTIELEDGGTRDYVLTPGGDDGFQIDQVTDHTEAEIGQPLRLQARATPTGALSDARITVVRLRRIPQKDLSADEYDEASLYHYYRVVVRVRNRLDTPLELGSLGFSLAQKDGVAVGQPQASFSEIGSPLPTKIDPQDTVSGTLFFAIPSESIAKPDQVWFTMGIDATGAKLVWKKSKG